MRFILFLGLIFLAGCTQAHLSVQTDFISRETLASNYVGTPDPNLDYPPIGQRLVIEWFFPKTYLAYTDLHLELTVRLRDRHEDTVTIPVPKQYGVFVYFVTNQHFVDSGGIQTYKIDVVGDGHVIKEWRHQLWVDLISFEIPCNL